MPAPADQPVLFLTWRDCLFRVADGVQPPKAGSLFFCRHLVVRPGERLLEIGAGLGLAAVLAARAGAVVTATDIVPAAIESIRANAALNGVTIDVRQGDGWAPVGDERFDVVCTNPPQMPTPPGRDRDDAEAAADNGGPDGWALLDRVIAGAPAHLEPGGRLMFSIFDFLGVKTAHRKLEAAGLVPRIVAQETQSFPRIGYERLDHLRAIDRESTLPADGLPRTVERYILEGTWGARP
jgi:release factor glutamine methyltransferase